MLNRLYSVVNRVSVRPLTDETAAASRADQQAVRALRPDLPPPRGQAGSGPRAPRNKAPGSPQMRAMTPSWQSKTAAASDTPPAFNASQYAGSASAMRYATVSECMEWAHTSGFSVHPTGGTSYTARNAFPSYDASSGMIRYRADPSKPPGSIHLNTQAMGNETLAALTIIHEVTHAARGSRDHAANWGSYLNERHSDEGESVYATLKFAESLFKSGATDPRQFAQDAAIAMPPACIRDWMAAYDAHGGQASDTLFLELGQIYDRHVPQSGAWRGSFDRMCQRLGVPPEPSRLTEIA